jgi:hypothetical protein
VSARLIPSRPLTFFEADITAAHFAAVVESSVDAILTGTGRDPGSRTGPDAAYGRSQSPRHIVFDNPGASPPGAEAVA